MRTYWHLLGSFLFMLSILSVPIVLCYALLNMVYSWIFSGENTRSAILRTLKMDSKKEGINNCNLVAILGEVQLDLKDEELEETKLNKVQVNINSFLGKIKVVVPKGVSVLIENKGLFSHVNILNQIKTKIIVWQHGQYNENIESGYPELIVRSRVYFSRIEIINKDKDT